VLFEQRAGVLGRQKAGGESGHPRSEQCLAQYFLGKRSRYEPFRFDAVKKPLAEKSQFITNPLLCMLITWDSRNWRRL
jgi:hypothetical protein